MTVLDPQSTTFQRSEAWRLQTTKGGLRWRQQWVPYAQISDHLKRAVIASEDDGYAMHDGVDWDAVGSRNPSGRVGTPQDIAGLAIFLSSRAGEYVVGQTIACDGGVVGTS